ncbi:ABC transporter ATP-binding protein [Algihabitans albus]|uniref:ABC transporter ATP-binding protein n=1 Tax=Algihabitans albus TaxID=2164067 RepID=UPI000E5D87F2|nr:ABC transporter ATP-binding protein [Algihabitans albus]
MSRLLDLAGLRVTLPTADGPLEAVRGVDLWVERGETLCLVGESGCGKSMTALSLLRLLPPRAHWSVDRYAFDGRDLLADRGASVEALRGAHIGMVFQDPMTALNPTFRIGDQLSAVYRRHRGGDRRTARNRAVELLERVGISNAPLRLRQYPHELSGGLRQRVMIAMAVLCMPALIVADEPTTALDVTIQIQILALLKDLQSEFGIGVILISHDLGVVSRVADRIAVMYAGQVVETGGARTILGSPRHPYTRGLLDSVPRPDPAQRGQPLGTIPGTVPSLVAPPKACAFSSRCSRVQPDCETSVPALLQLPADSGDRWLRCLNPLAAGDGA